MARSKRSSARGTLQRFGSLVLVVLLLSAFVGPLPAMAVWPPVMGAETEPNDTWATADPLPTDGTIVFAAYNPANDLDYYAVSVVAGHTYRFENGPDMSDLTLNFDSITYLYDADGVTQLSGNDDGGPANYDKIIWTADATKTVYVLTEDLGLNNTGLYGIRAVDMTDAPVSDSTISGTVTDTEVGPLEGIQVTDWFIDPWFELVDTSYRVEASSALTDADGEYTLDASEGIHIIQFTDLSGAHYEQYYDGADWDTATGVEVVDTPVTGIDAEMEIIPPMYSRVTETIRASLDADGEQGEDDDGDYRGSRTPALSADGRYVAFYSGNAFVEDDTNGLQDWYLKDLEDDSIELVSVATDGTQADESLSNYDGTCDISGNGRYVVFDSNADTLDSSDTNGRTDVFIRDVVDSTTVRVSENADGSDGFVETDGSSYYGSRSPVISRDGRYVVFYTRNAFVEDDVNDLQDWYRKDMTDGTFELVSIATDGTQADNTDSGEQSGADRAEITPDGRYVVFDSWATSLVDDDTNGYRDVFMRDMDEGTTVRASEDAEGSGDYSYGSRTPAVSADGRYVVFVSGNDYVEEDTNDNTTDWYRKDTTDGSIELVSVNIDGESGDDGAWSNDGTAAISDNNRYIAFITEASDMVGGDDNEESDVFVRDMEEGLTSVVSVNSARILANEDAWTGRCAMSADGSVVAYENWATNLVADDTNEGGEGGNCADVFVSYLDTGDTETEALPLEGKDRYETAIEISQESFPEGADTVVIATGQNWPDALGGAALAGVVGGPVLLSYHDMLPASVAGEIERLGATNAYILGDYRALDDSVYDAVEDIVGTDGVMRIGGDDRYETAEFVGAEVVELLGSDYDGTAFVATGLTFADALSASPLAAAQGWPVYLSGMPTISDQTLAAMEEAGVSDVILLGGEAALSVTSAAAVKAAGFDSIRLDGDDRYETSVEVAEYGVAEAGLGWDGVAIATGQDFPDALSGGPLQGMSGSVMLLVQKYELPMSVANVLSDHAGAINEVRFLGGLPAVSAAVRADVMDALMP